MFIFLKHICVEVVKSEKLINLLWSRHFFPELSCFIFSIWISLLLGVTSIDAFYSYAAQTWQHMSPDSRGHLLCGFFLWICTSLILCEVRAEKSVPGSAFVHKNTRLADFSFKCFNLFLSPQPRCLEGVDNQARGAGNSGQDSPNVSICPGCCLSHPLTKDADHGPGNADVGGWICQGTTWYLHLKSSHLSGINVLDPSFKHTTTAYTSTTAAGGHLCCCPP